MLVRRQLIGRGVQTDIPNAFGVCSATDSGQTYVGWSAAYWGPSGSILGVNMPVLDGVCGCGTIWTENFWWYLGEGCTVTQAEDNTDWYSDYWGWMNEFLYNYGGPDATWLYR